MNVFAWVLSNKLLSFLSAATIALLVSTIVVAVNNSDLKDDLDYCQLQLTSTTTSTTPTTESPATEEPTESPEEDMTDYILPTNVIPELYELYLYPYLADGTYKGTVHIDADVNEKTNTVKLHSKGLTISSVKINDVTASWTEDEKHELLTLASSAELDGKIKISIEFSGDMKNRIVGLYQSTYTNAKGEVRAMATSKFEPTYARQAFPCFDEPNMKAKFQVNLLKPADDSSYRALSNMPEESQEETADGILVRFKESVKMSTYLSCFIVSDFDYTEVKIQLNETYSIPLRVYATPEQIDKAEYAKQIGKSVIEFYNDYFGIDFPLPKLDMAAIPDFVSGAMEHWGLVTYRETALLYSTEISATTNKIRVASVIAHELAHSWFGNLVTMNWWNDLWLNEGFASYIEYKGIDHAEKDWKMMDQFLTADLHPVLKLDSTVSSHPIVQTVTTPDEITSIFDTISYNKGASVLRMLEDAVTEDIFRQGVINYLKKHQYGNAVTQDLWDELQALTDVVDITEFMSTWTEQMGYPVVTVKEQGDNYILTQKRYLTDQDAIDNKVTPYNYTWMIPITYITNDSSTSTLFWFPQNLTQIEIKKPVDAKWVKFNYKQVGYYRVIYEEAHWRQLIDNIKDMETAEKAHLIEETFRLAESGHINYDIPFDLAGYMIDETEYVPFSALTAVAGELKTFLLSSQQYTKFREYITNLVTPAYKFYTWTETPVESDLVKRSRVQVLTLACNFGHSECLETASEKFVSWLESDSVVLSQDLRTIIYNYGMANSAPEYWDVLFERFVKEKDAGEKLRLLNGLSFVRDTSYLTKLINLAKTDEYIRSQDYFTCLQYISSNPVGTSIVWDYVREHWLELVDRFTLNDRYLGTLIPAITATFATETKLEEIRAFFAKYPDAGAGAAARLKTIETVENNIKWLANYKTQVESWLETNVKV